jgi:2-amino-4-hydroxy-6-hydroxymethyldihydropteridine diphosphokinase
VVSTRAYLGLGSNVGDRLGTLRRAVQALREAGARQASAGEPALRVTRCSAVYETVALGPDGLERPEQPAFLNAVVEVDTTLAAASLHWLTLGIEAALGRRADASYAPRTLDIDLLLYGEARIDEAGLVVPHPRMAARGFVMVPLAELAPDRVPRWTGPAPRRVAEAL